MAVQNLRYNTAYGFSDPLLNVFPAPIISQRSPTGNDKAQLGQTWVNTLTDQVYTLASIVNNVANWAVSAVGGGGLTTANADAGSATTLADAMTFAGGSNINTSAAAHTVTFNLDNTISVSGSITAGTGITSTTGNIVATAGSLIAGLNVSASTTVSAVVGMRISSFGAGVLQTDSAGNFLSSNGTNGQILIGGGAAPVWATITPGANIAIVNTANAITISAVTGSDTIHYTGVTTTPYVVLGTDNYLGVNSTSAPITIQLPNAPAVGRAFVIKDSFGEAATNNITVTTVGGIVDIDGATSYIITADYEAIQLIFNGTFYEVY